MFNLFENAFQCKSSFKKIIFLKPGRPCLPSRFFKRINYLTGIIKDYYLKDTFCTGENIISSIFAILTPTRAKI
jgi:hypothetical protein